MRGLGAASGGTDCGSRFSGGGFFAGMDRKWAATQAARQAAATASFDGFISTVLGLAEGHWVTVVPPSDGPELGLTVVTVGGAI